MKLKLPVAVANIRVKEIAFKISGIKCHAFLFAGRLRDKLRHDCTVHQNVQNVVDRFFYFF